MKVLVKGAGVAGLAIAYELATRGAAVTVADIRPCLGDNASWAAGGMLAPWCERASAEQPVLDFGQGAADWWEAAVAGQVTRAGTLVVAMPRDAGELDHFARRTSGCERVGPDEIARLEPDLADPFSRGLFFAGEAHLDPRQALAALYERIVALGGDFRFGCDAHGLHGFEQVVECTGMAAGHPELRGVRGEMLILHAPDVSLTRPVRLLHPRFPLYIVPRSDHHFMVGATMIESDDAGPVTVRSMMELMSAACALYPAFGEASIVETCAAVRPAFPDNLPRVETIGNGLAINGLYRHGFLLAPAMARLAADALFSHDKLAGTAHEDNCQRRSA